MQLGDALLNHILDVHAARRCQRTCSRRWSRCRRSLRLQRTRRPARLGQPPRQQRSLIWLWGARTCMGLRRTSMQGRLQGRLRPMGPRQAQAALLGPDPYRVLQMSWQRQRPLRYAPCRRFSLHVLLHVGVGCHERGGRASICLCLMLDCPSVRARYAKGSTHANSTCSSSTLILSSHVFLNILLVFSICVLTSASCPARLRRGWAQCPLAQGLRAGRARSASPAAWGTRAVMTMMRRQRRRLNRRHPSRPAALPGPLRRLCPSAVRRRQHRGLLCLWVPTLGSAGRLTPALQPCT